MRAHYHIIPLSLFTYKLFAKARMSISFDITGISLFKWVFTIIYDINYYFKTDVITLYLLISSIQHAQTI